MPLRPPPRIDPGSSRNFSLNVTKFPYALPYCPIQAHNGTVQYDTGVNTVPESTLADPGLGASMTAQRANSESYE